MAGVCNIGYSTRLLKKSSAIERSNKGGFRSGVPFTDSFKSQIAALELDLPPACECARRAHHAERKKTQSGFGVSSLSGFRRRNVEIRGPFNAKVRHIDQIDLYPPETAHLRAQKKLSAGRAQSTAMARGVLHWSNAAQMAWMRPPTQGLFRPPVGGAQRGGQRCLSP